VEREERAAAAASLDALTPQKVTPDQFGNLTVNLMPSDVDHEAVRRAVDSRVKYGLRNA